MENQFKIIPMAWAIGKGIFPIISVTKVKHVEDAAKAARVTLKDDEIKDLENLTDTLVIDIIHYWEKVMD